MTRIEPHRPGRFRSRVEIFVAGSKVTLVLQGAQIVTAGVAVLVGLLAAASMAPTGRGDLAFWLQIGYVLTTLALLGIERPYAARGADSFDVASADLVRLMRPAAILTGVMFLSSGATYGLGETEIAVLIAGLGFFVISNQFVRFLRTAYISSGSPIRFIGFSLAGQAFLLIGALTLSANTINDPLAWFALYIVSSLPHVVPIVRSAWRREPSKAPVIREVRRSGLRLLPASFGNTAMLRSDRLLLPVLASSEALGLYIVVASVMELASWPVQNWVDASLKRWRTDNPNGSQIFTSVARTAAFAVAMSVAMGLASAAIIIYFLSESYAPSLALIIPLGMAGVVYSLSRVLQGHLVSRGRNTAVSLSELIGMVVSVGLYLLLIPTHGAEGAAWGSLAGYSVCFFVALGRLIQAVR
ncbi:lipopolysaccharide biosynthesis protein [Frigoribacterium sp. PhB24]|uniref:lipopolysaccharide biosynthesis protein n=1 Tax=Frigoribacterium sp. PhB24 TaxID=2485204 RepID=UPI000F47E4CC|nr:polysaccharide biosynthesis C-terminal domain-containing protein [Frigoribacterium sp. PhB24]ROS54736.1 O-antigen/teichoic acid export membrane protein [Frigoribacterium sp. PhB24]